MYAFKLFIKYNINNLINTEEKIEKYFEEAYKIFEIYVKKCNLFLLF